ARVLKAVAERIQTAPLGYTEACGTWELRSRIAQHYRDEYGVSVSPERIFVTLGSSSAFLMTLLTAFDHDAEVAITRPCYPAYPNIMQSVNIRPAFLRGEEQNKFHPTIAALDALPRRPKGLIIASPSNPTGTLINDADLAALVEYCAAQKIRIISDEIYHGITYGMRAHTILAHTDQAIVVNSFSKYFLMPGWRVGWAVVPPQMATAFGSLASSMFISPSAVGQYAALEIFNCKDELDATVAGYAENRRILLDALPAMGITRLAPVEGAFFVYANVSHLTGDSVAFCRSMLHDTGIVAIPGVDFDREEGHHYVRFSFSGARDDMAEAMARLKAWLK
ncbi:MAG: aminotransferase class I/II-fold pyridoxal phosphate-dependent enzyme, partial [Candidatus Sungbacteria bacterium]|nr:aminotransferase class I/II-fold pyridoxal phosphate-dependent enzyme [Candidatus Sungbacteria bacterium]